MIIDNKLYIDEASKLDFDNVKLKKVEGKYVLYIGNAWGVYSTKEYNELNNKEKEIFDKCASIMQNVFSAMKKNGLELNIDNIVIFLNNPENYAHENIVLIDGHNKMNIYYTDANDTFIKCHRIRAGNAADYRYIIEIQDNKLSIGNSKEDDILYYSQPFGFSYSKEVYLDCFVQVLNHSIYYPAPVGGNVFIARYYGDIYIYYLTPQFILSRFLDNIEIFKNIADFEISDINSMLKYL